MTGKPPACVLAHYDRDEQNNWVLRARPTPCQPGALLCRGHFADIERTVSELPALASELEQQMVPGSGAGGPKISGDPETSVPFNERAGQHLRIIEHQLGTWVRVVIDERGLRGPARPTVNSLASFLTAHHEWLVAQEFTREYATQMRDLRTDGRRILAAVPSRRVDLGQCGEPVSCDVESHAETACAGVLSATVSRVDDELPAAVVCSVCGRQHPSPTWRALGRRLRGSDDAWLTGPQLSELFRVPFSTIRRWASEDEWRRLDLRPRKYHMDDASTTYEQRRQPTTEGAAS